MLLRLCSFLFLLWMGGANALAENINVRTLALRSGEMPEIFLKGSKGHEVLKFSAIQPSASVRTTLANPLPIYKSVANTEGEASFVIDQKVKLPVGAKSILLLGWVAGGENRYVAIADDFGAARFNDWLLINASKKAVAFKVGDKTKPISVKPGSSGNYRIREDKGQGAAVVAQAEIRGKMQLFYSTYWPVQEGKRVMVLFVDDGEKIRVKRISDTLAPPKDEAGED